MAYILLQNQTSPEINKNVLLKSLTIHNVIWLDISMNNFQDMHYPQQILDFFDIVDWDFLIVTNLCGKFNTFLCDDHVKSHNLVDFGTNLELWKEKEEKVLP